MLPLAVPWLITWDGGGNLVFKVRALLPVFVFNLLTSSTVPFLALFLGLALYNVPSNLGLDDGNDNESFVTAMKSFDYRGSIVLTSAITFLILGLVRSPSFQLSIVDMRLYTGCEKFLLTQPSPLAETSCHGSTHS